MFTIKLYNSEDSYEVMEAPHYHISNLKTKEGLVTEITIYKNYFTTEGISYRVSSADLEVPHFKYAFIENSNGKTIDHIR